jgi:hypothetical protein
MPIEKAFRSVAKRLILPIVGRLRDWLDQLDEQLATPPEVPFDNNYMWLRHAFHELLKDELCARKPMYVWGIVQGAALGKVLGIPRISVIEFGVAGGAGLISMEHIAQRVEAMTGMRIDVYGFDTGAGLPKPEDYRDQPNMWFEGQLPMNRDTLGKQLQRASLRLGLVRETVPQLLGEGPAPVAFVSFDLDLYSSTRDALTLFTAKQECLLPRVVCYFDDIMGHSYSDFSGERLAITEFNQAQETSKLSPIYGLRYYAPRRMRDAGYWDCLYLAHFFDHPLYNELDSIMKSVYTDDRGRDYRLRVSSDWQSEIPL